MGAWGNGAFDNDSAADFASHVEHCSDVQARQDLLLATLRGVKEMSPTRLDNVQEEYELPYEIEQAVAAAAFVADAADGEHTFTNTPYAQGQRRDPDNRTQVYWYDIELGQPRSELMLAALEAMTFVLRTLVERGIGWDRQQAPKKVHDKLWDKLPR